MTIIIPEMTRKDVSATRYTDPSTGVTYVRPGYEAEVGKHLVRYKDGAFAGRKTQEQAMELLTEQGFQLPTMAQLWHLVVTEGKESQLFYELFGKDLDGNYTSVFRWEHTGTKLVTPYGWEPAQMDGGKYVRDVFEYQDGKYVQVAEAQRIPLGKNRRIVETNLITGIPLETTDSEVEHLGHWNFTPELPETVASLGSRWYEDSLGCFDVSASSVPSSWNAADGFRPVRGKVPEVVKEGE